MQDVKPSEFTKKNYFKLLADAGNEVGSVLPWGRWSETYQTRFDSMRKAVAERYGGPEIFLKLPDEKLLDEDLAAMFNDLITPLTRGEVENKDTIWNWHGPIEVSSARQSGSQPPRPTHHVPYPAFEGRKR